ncbi:MAG TPA: fatty acid--CoA ligase family protein, partial [Acidimicrobiia bacterium]|nr:fatty acid--CoA ligase family protein [Acidimicrobiia bacterium]
RMLVFKNRMQSLREIVAASVGHGDRDYVIFTDGVTERRFTFREHERLVASTAAAMRDRYGIRPGDRVAILGANSAEWIIAFWATVCLGAIAFLLGGVKAVWLTGRFDPVVAMKVIERERITGWSFTETVLHRLVNHPDVGKYDLTSVRQCGGGGSPISPALQARAREVFPSSRNKMGVGYGLTECSALATLNSGPELQAYPTSAGRPLPTVQLEIRDPNGKTLHDGEEGEVCIRGPIVMLEYWRRPEETAAAIGPGRWLRTGDIGRVDDGRLFLASRKRDLILRGGENVSPVEIEHRLAEHPDVAEVAVEGVDHPELGQDVKAIVVARPGAEVDAEELTEWVASHLAYFKVPSVWEIRSEPLPRTATGKVMKHVLTEGRESAFIED